MNDEFQREKSPHDNLAQIIIIFSKFPEGIAPMIEQNNDCILKISGSDLITDCPTF